MSRDSRSRIAQALAGSPAAFDSQGLQQPAIDPIMMASSMGGPALARALAGMSRSAPMMLANEAGAIFPEGVSLSSLPQDRVAMQELKTILPESQRMYRGNEAIADWHASMGDYPAVLKDKWRLLNHFGGN